MYSAVAYAATRVSEPQGRRSCAYGNTGSSVDVAKRPTILKMYARKGTNERSWGI